MLILFSTLPPIPKPQALIVIMASFLVDSGRIEFGKRSPTREIMGAIDETPTDLFL